VFSVKPVPDGTNKPRALFTPVISRADVARLISELNSHGQPTGDLLKLFDLLSSSESSVNTKYLVLNYRTRSRMTRLYFQHPREGVVELVVPSQFFASLEVVNANDPPAGVAPLVISSVSASD
jgi:hypothetical protein